MPGDQFINPTAITWVIHSVLAVTLTVRVIMKRPSTGVALAWLLVINAIPILGAVIYLLIGERRISPTRVQGISQLRSDFREIIKHAVDDGLLDVDWSKHSEAARNMSRLGWNLVGSPTVTGSSFQLLSDTNNMLKTIVRDVDTAHI